MIAGNNLLLSIRKNKPLIFVMLFFGVLFLELLSTHMLLPIDGDLYSGGSTWADLAVHLTMITSFTERGLDTILNNPIYFGSKLSYPFIPDLITAIFYKFGLSLRLSLLIPSFIFLMLLVYSIYKLSFKITKKKILSLTVPFLFFFNGTLFGTYYFWTDKQSSGLSLLEFLGKMKVEYGHLADYNIRFSNIVADYILPQRAIILGLLLGLISLYFLWEYWDKRKTTNLYKTAIFISLLPLVHTHSFITLLMASGLLGILDLFLNRNEFRKTLKDWIGFSLIALVVSLPQLLLVLPQGNSSFIKFNFGWMKNPEESILEFWIKNLFPHLFVFIAGFVVAPKKIKLFFVPFLVIFVITNLILFQPHNYDNMKIMLYSFLMSCILSVFIFDWLFKKINNYAIFFVGFILLTMTITGGLSVYRESYVSWQMFSKEDVRLSEFVKTNTNKNDVFLTSDRHNNPIPCLTGRQILMGYRGWLWTYGINYSQREQDVSAMYAGGDYSRSLLKHYKVKYVLIETSQSNQYINEEFFSKNYKKVFKSQNFNLYKI